VDAQGKPLRPTRDGVPGNERLVCLDAATGKVLWRYAYPCPYRLGYNSGPRSTPLVRAGRVYALGAMGDLFCLDSQTGKPHWKINVAQQYKLEEPQTWGWAASPVLEGDRLYCLVGGPGSAVVAFHKDTGKEVWKALTTEEIGYSPPVLLEAGGKRQLIVWLSEAVFGLDPASGAEYWTQRYPANGAVQRPAVNIATVQRIDRERLFLSSYYHGPMMLQLAADKPEAKLLWSGQSNNPSRPDGLHTLMSNPIYKDGFLYGVCANGELRCIDAATNKQKWQTYEATGGEATDCGTAFLTPQGERVVIFNDAGELILAKLSPTGYKQLDKARILEPVQFARGRKVVWCHPAFAQKCVFARNDKEMVCVSLAAG
jgi:outer membrane protein assembly factor BamB